MGSRNVKALVVQGNGSVNVKDPQAVADLSDYMLREVIGSNNNHVVPQTQQEWAEFYDKGSRWSARLRLARVDGSVFGHTPGQTATGGPAGSLVVEFGPSTRASRSRAS